ncbi:hypothetical protein BKA70DRAFT_1053204, partial [Coprinopsis sp. MPI-PUGE-AT-0042]
KNKTLVSKLAKRPDTFLVSEAVIHQIPQLLVTFYPRVRNLFPHPVSRTEDLSNEISETRSTTKIQLEKVPCL